MRKVESFYDERSRTYDAAFDCLYYRVYDAITWRYLEPHVPTNPDAMILDAGGGTGRWTIPMAKKGGGIVLLDISEEMLNIAREKAAAEGLQDRVIVQKGDITRIDYPDETFDLVLCDHVLFLFQDPGSVIGELARVLKWNRPLIISAINRYVSGLMFVPEDLEKGLDELSGRSKGRLLEGPKSFRERFKRFLERRFFASGKKVEPGPRVYNVTPDKFRELLQNNGLRIESMVGKVVTMPLRIPPKTYNKKDYSQSFFEKILKIELALCERPDAIGLAGHLQAIVYKT